MVEVLTHMIEALGLEVAAIKKRGSGTQVGLRGGERVGQAEGAWLYRFILAEDLSLRDDTPVRVTVDQDDVSGLLVSFADGVLIVALEKDIGSRIATAHLVANDCFLIELLKERLEKVRSGEVRFNRTMANKVIGLVPPCSTDAAPDPSVFADGTANTDQILAVTRSLGSDTTYVWGPPGTGKTTTLARIVEAHYRAGRSVLLVSNTNIAVDTALERVAERLKGEPDFHQGLVIRQGPVVKEELRQRFGSQVILKEILARLGEKLLREKGKLLEEAELLKAEELSLMAVLKDIERLTSARRTYAVVMNKREDASATIAIRKQDAQRHRVRALKLRSDLERAKSMGVLRRLLSGLNPKRLAQEAAGAEDSEQAAADAARAIEADLPKLDAEIESLRKEVTRLAAETRKHPPAQEIEARFGTLRPRLSQIDKRVEAIDRELAELRRKAIERCRILATTVYRTYLGSDALRQFDVAVVDEASMLMPPLVYYAAGLCTQSVTVAGDFRQLPPIVMSDSALTRTYLKCDVFEKANIPGRLAQKELPPHLVALRTQYRMREQICDVVNDLFYADYPLHSDPSVNHGNDGFPLSKAALLYVDTAPFHPWTAFPLGTYSRYNLLHALLVRNIVLYLDDMGFLPPAGRPNDAVGAVAPYASQARLIQALLNDRLGDRAAGIAATVHRFQGNEKAAMVLDLTDSLGAPLSRFLQATRIEEDGARLLNVAISRARQHVILLANFKYIRAKAPRKGYVHRLLDLFENHGETLDLKALLPLAEQGWIDGLHQVLPDTFDLPKGAAGAFTEGTFYPAFLRDLVQARKSIVIFSPFATGRGTGRWVDPLRAALARRVCIRILMRPPQESGEIQTDELGELVRALRDLGVVVDLRAQMHEKIAILDGHTLWHGSLNILSHRDTHESMLRIESTTGCQQLSRFLTTPASRHRKDNTPSLEAPENPKCPTCGGPTIWNTGREGIWFKCENPACDGRIGTRRTRRDARGNGAGRQGQPSTRKENVSNDTNGRRCPEPGCGGELRMRNGRYGPFLGCSNYPRCRHTEDL